MTEAERLVTGTATERMTRVLFFGASLTGLAFSGLAGHKAVNQIEYVNDAWGYTVWLLVWASPIVLVIMSWRAPLAVLRRTAIVFVIVYSIAILTWPLAQNVPRIPDGMQPWVIDLLPLACLSAAVVMPSAGAWAYLVGICLAAAGLRYVADGRAALSNPIEDMLFNATTIAVFVAIVIVTLHAGRRRDAEAERTAADAVLAAVSDAEGAERTYVAALTHDDVLSTLHAAAVATPATATLVRGSATRALDRLDSLSEVEVEEGAAIEIAAFVENLRAIVAATSADVYYSAPDGAAGTLPKHAANALSEATAEAVRNSVRHAEEGGLPVAREVNVVVNADRVTIAIVDDGVGFDPRVISLERFGIRYSIRHRLAAIPGGSAEIDSAPGAGTHVTLSWRRGGDAVAN